MKFLSFVFIFTLVGCASGSNKKSDGKSQLKSKSAAAKAEVKKEVKKSVKKAVTKKKSQMSSEKKTTCSYGENTRVLENKFSDNGGCEVLYTKDGSTSSIATAKAQLDYCQEVYDRVVTKLTNAGFKCK